VETLGALRKGTVGSPRGKRDLGYLRGWGQCKKGQYG